TANTEVRERNETAETSNATTSASTPNSVLGFQSAPAAQNNAAVVAAQTAGTVAGAQTAPTTSAGVQNLPSTSTSSETLPFADFVGFTALADDLDPEELQLLVSGIFEDLAEEALRHDGTIEKFIGDAIFVIFGAPIAHEDDPQRALRCALGMQRIFSEHAARVKGQLGIELGLRIGIHTGMVVAGAVRAPAEYGVMGDTANTASRLQAAAAPGEIYGTQATFRLTNREFSFREVGPIEMKGKDRPVLAY